MRKTEAFEKLWFSMLGNLWFPEHNNGNYWARKNYEVFEQLKTKFLHFESMKTGDLMDVGEKFFNKISNRERVIFEGAITMGALFHQFVGTPVSIKSAESLEKSIKEAMELQPCIEEVNIKIDKGMLEDAISEFEYTSLSGEMLDVKVVSIYDNKKAVIRMKFIDELNYPLMFVEDID